MTERKDEKCQECDGWGCYRYLQVFYDMTKPCPDCRGTGRKVKEGE